MEQFIDFEIIIYLAWRIGFGCVFTSIVLFFVVIRVRRFYTKKAERAANFREIWEVILLASLDRIPQDLPPIEEKDQLTLLTLWNYVHELLLEESTENLLELAERIELPLMAKRILRKRNLKGRLLAVKTLGSLKDKKSWDLLKKLVTHQDTIFSLAAAQALIRINPRRATWLILPLIAKRRDWSVDMCADLIRQIGADEATDNLILQLNRTPQSLLPKLIRLLETLPSDETNLLIGKFLNQYDDKEIIFACLLVFKDVENLHRVRHFLTHDNWEIRMQAAICLGKFGSEEDVECIASVTNDTEWWVRYRSAQALAKLPTMTIERLRSIAQFRADEFSQDVILRVATEMEVAESCGLSY